jgi:hypothetical protein
MKSIEEIVTIIKKLPHTEFNYYLVLLLAIVDEESEQQRKEALLVKIDNYVTHLKTFYHAPETALLPPVISALVELNTIAQTRTLFQQILRYFLNIVGVLFAIVAGIIGGLLGIGAGLFFHPNPLKGLLAGMQVGLVVGMTLGYRFPTKFVRFAYNEKLDVCLASLNKLTKKLDETFAVQYFKCKKTIKKQIKRDFLPEAADDIEREVNFTNFLNSPQFFQVCTAPSGLVDRQLDGTLGHHALIRYHINGKVGIPMEFGNRNGSPRWVLQAECSRKVTGQVLFDMLVLDMMLIESHPKNMEFILKDFRVGDNDCLTYVNKILVGTHQAPASIRRFSEEKDSWIGLTVIRPCVEFIRSIPDEDMEKMAPLIQSDAIRNLKFYSKPRLGDIQQVEGWPSLSRS